MEDYYYRRKYANVPAFGSWDWNDGVAFTECFESSREAAGQLVHYSYSPDERDLYVTGDLYQNDVVTPAMIVVPRSTTKCQEHVERGKKQSWVNDVKKEDASIPVLRPVPKPVDDDLYKIPPEIVYANTKKKRGLSLFLSCCLIPANCDAPSSDS